MTPHSHTRRVTVRRSVAVLAAMLVIGGTPLVAQALDDEAEPFTVPEALPTPVQATPPIPTLGAGLDEPTTPAVGPTTSSTASVDGAPVPEPVTESPVTASPTEPPTAPVVDQPIEVPSDTVPLPALPTLAALPPGPGASAWAALRECESGGDYSITNPSGKYRGAYQFDRSTWDSVAGRHIPSLVGVDPAAASPSDQDALAYALYTERGANPWPHCGRHLR